MPGRLAGRVFASTRQAAASEGLARALDAEGAQIRIWPPLAFDGPRDPATLMEALQRISEYDWVVFTSPRSVEAVATRVGWPRDGTRIAAVGEGTQQALEAHGWIPDMVGEGDGARGLVRAMVERYPMAGASVLFPASSMARPVLEGELFAAGARVDRVEAYRTVVSPPPESLVRADLAKGVDGVVFASPSAVRGLSTALGGLGAGLGCCTAVAIGETTAEALARAGVARVVVAGNPSIEGLIEACVRAVQE